MGYLVIGIIWCGWLEWFTTKQGMGDWVWRERIFHTVLWPVSLFVFISNIFKGL